MNTMQKMYRFLLILFVLVCFAGCKQQEQPDSPLDEQSPNEKGYLVNDCSNLKLERRIRRSEYVAGKRGQFLEMHLKNMSMFNIEIRDWFTREDYNVKVFYAPCQFGQSDKLQEKDWIQVHPDKNFSRTSFQRTILTLNPGNKVLVDAPLAFLEQFKIPAKQAKVHIALRAELNTSTARSETPVYEVDIVPNVKNVYSK